MVTLTKKIFFSILYFKMINNTRQYTKSQTTQKTSLPNHQKHKMSNGAKTRKLIGDFFRRRQFINSK